MITGKYSIKEYKCPRCGAIEKHGTNHWGEIYVSCKSCSWKHPLEYLVVMECQEPLPEGYDKPTPWKMVKLGDIYEIKEGKKIDRR